MIVVSDTSAVSNLVQIRADHLLQDLYGQVLIPPSVDTELRRFHASLPTWIMQRAPSDREFMHRLASELDLGEAEAIALAKEVRADWLLIDEKVGRQVARREGLALLGLGGVLLMAKDQGLIPEVGSHLDQLERHAGFYLGQQVKTELLHRAGEIIPRSDPSS